MKRLLTGLMALCALGGAAQAATDADRAFVAKVSQGGMYEVAAGKLATTKASAPDVRDFAVAEVHDHVLVGDGLKSVAAAEGITFAATLNADFTAKLNHLSGLSGAAFDAAYMSDMATLHDGDGAAFAKEAGDGGSAAFRAFGAQTSLIVKRHIGAIHAASPS
jgi:putative membrane protein